MFRNEEQALRNNSQVIKDKLHEPRNEEQTLGNNFQVIREEVYELEMKHIYLEIMIKIISH